MVFTYQKNADGLFVCLHCPKTYKSQSSMNYHYGTAHGLGELKHVCTVKGCTAKYWQKCHLDDHMKTQHSKGAVYVCPHPNCGTSDIRKGNIISHFCRVHLEDLVKNLLPSKVEKDKPICCQNCKKDYKSRPSFNYHIHRCVSPAETHPEYPHFQKLSTLVAQNA